MHISNECGHCAAQTRSRRREFSDQIWSVLITWGEVQTSLVDSPICDDCYNEFREVLIDRAQELEMAIADPDKYQQMVKEEQKRVQKLRKAAGESRPAPAAKKKAPAKKKAKTATKKKATAAKTKKKTAAKKTTKKTTTKKTASKKSKTTKKKGRKVGKLAS